MRTRRPSSSSSKRGGGSDRNSGREGSKKSFDKKSTSKKPSFKKRDSASDWDGDKDRSKKSFSRSTPLKKSSFKKNSPSKEWDSDKDRSKKPFSKSTPSKRSSFKKSSESDGEVNKERPKGSFSKNLSKRTSSKPFSESERGDDSTRKSFKKPAFKKSFSDKDRTEKSPRKFSGKRGGTPIRKRAPKFAAQNESSDLIRLNKYISNSGVCSRREADELITMGLITVNDEVITELGYKVKPTDTIRHEGKHLKAEKPVYVLINKPKGYITTTHDPQDRKTVMQLIGRGIKERIYPVGRLDRNTTGLLLLTNDGDLSVKLSHPSYKVKKIYKVELDKPLTKDDVEKIMKGVRLEEGKVIVDDLAIVSNDGKTLGLELHIGWNRIVRRLFEELGYEVVKLDRTMYAGLDKKDLPRGNWRFLSKEEVVKLKHFQ